MDLPAEMKRAIATVRQRSATNDRWKARIDGVPGASELLAQVARRGRVAIHFHPERVALDGRSVAEGLLESGVFKTQWETGISTGSPSAFEGGARSEWESRLFDGAYEGVTPSMRPRYGALRLFGHPDGPAPRFGSSYFVLAAGVLKRSTFTYPGSQEPVAVEQTATADLLAPVFGPLFEAADRDATALGVSRMSASALVERARQYLTRADDWRPNGEVLGASLDSFVEVQIHGPVRLDADVVGLVSDPAFKGTEVEEALAELCQRWDIELAWHPGFRVPVDAIPSTFRGWEIGTLAHRAAREGYVDARGIGELANEYELDPKGWDYDTRDDALTALRRIWHALVAHS